MRARELVSWLVGMILGGGLAFGLVFAFNFDQPTAGIVCFVCGYLGAHIGAELDA